MWVMINIIIIIFITIKSLLVQPVGMLHQSHYRATAKEEQRSTKSQMTDNYPHHPNHTNHPHHPHHHHIGPSWTRQDGLSCNFPIQDEANCLYHRDQTI